MQYVASWAGMHFTQKLAGTYEKELAGVVEEICGRTYGTVVNIGAADGYYACGLAFRLPDVKAIAFELRPEMGPLIRTIAKANRLDERVQIGGLCTSDALREAMTGGEPILVVCDIEGAEADLLDPILVPALLRADLLVEVHDHVRPNVSKLLADRFRASHVLDAIKPAPRVLGDWPAQLRLDPSLILKVMDEGRGTGISWLWMRSARPRQAQ
jgi:hypothetical protein